MAVKLFLFPPKHLKASTAASAGDRGPALLLQFNEQTVLGAEEEISGSSSAYQIGTLEASEQVQMDADGSSKRGPSGRRPRKIQKLKFKPKVPPQKPKKSIAENPQHEEPKPIDEELMKRLKTGQGATKKLHSIKDEDSTQNPPSTVSSAASVSSSLAPSGGHNQGQLKKKKPFQITRAVPLDAIPGFLYDDEDDDDDFDDDEGDDNAELQEIRPTSIECESSIRPAEELNLLGQDDKRRMLLFQLPKSLPLPRISPAVERNGKARGKVVTEGSNLNELPQGYMGKMLVYKSGKIKMKLGDIMFDVNPGEECRMALHAVAINTREKHCCLLGDIENRHVVVTPDVDSLLLNDNRDVKLPYLHRLGPVLKPQCGPNKTCGPDGQTPTSPA
uniref:DNA-directed RNA polymerase III subunit RPC4 n=1 Tax=Leersia perrieri TaxID=77586 RepID=A0A0D9V8S7_9ORYZ